MGNQNHSATLDFFIAESSINRMFRQHRKIESDNFEADQGEARQCNICKQVFMPESRQQLSCGKCTSEDASFVAEQETGGALPMLLTATRRTGLTLACSF